MWVQNSISSHGKAQKWATSDHDQKRQNCHSSLKRSNPNKIFLGDLNWLQKLHLSHRHPTLHLTLCPVFQHDQKPCFCCFLLKLPKKVPNLGQNIKIYSVSIHIVGLYGQMGEKTIRKKSVKNGPKKSAIRPIFGPSRSKNGSFGLKIDTDRLFGVQVNGKCPKKLKKKP